jgi:hypothetical protein
VPTPATPPLTKYPTPRPTESASQRIYNDEEIIAGVVSGLIVLAIAVVLLLRQHQQQQSSKEFEEQEFPSNLVLKVMRDGIAETIVFRTWDFAGQRIYYSLHHIFITPGSYLVVFSMVDAAKTPEQTMEYTLHNVMQDDRDDNAVKYAMFIM